MCSTESDDLQQCVVIGLPFSAWTSSANSLERLATRAFETQQAGFAFVEAQAHHQLAAMRPRSTASRTASASMIG